MAQDFFDVDSEQTDPELLEIFNNAPWDSLNRDSRLPQLTYVFEIKGVKLEWLPSKGVNKFGYIIHFEVVQPLQYAGRSHYERIYIGTDDDPKAREKHTWDASASGGARTQVAIMTHTNVEKIMDAVGKRICASVEHNGDYANLTGYAPEGSVVPGLEFKSTRYKNRGNVKQPIATPSTSQPCTMCGVTFPMSALADHMKGCNGTLNL
jgi:hypothetical protein